MATPARAESGGLTRIPTRKLEAVLECAGNAAGGSASSNAVWEGVPLAYLLRQAGVEPGATKVMLEGADSGRLMPDSPNLPYCQLVPIGKCLQPESLVAFKLNDRFLPRKNGFPARAFVSRLVCHGFGKVAAADRRFLGPDDPPSGFQASGMNKLYNRIVETAPGNACGHALTAESR